LTRCDIKRGSAGVDLKHLQQESFDENSPDAQFLFNAQAATAVCDATALFAQPSHGAHVPVSGGESQSSPSTRVLCDGDTRPGSDLAIRGRRCELQCFATPIDLDPEHGDTIWERWPVCGDTRKS